MVCYDKSHYFVDFTNSDKLTEDQKVALHKIQELYLPIERATFLGEYRYSGLITDDDYEQMTGIPYKFG